MSALFHSFGTYENVLKFCNNPTVFYPDIAGQFLRGRKALALGIDAASHRRLLEAP